MNAVLQGILNIYVLLKEADDEQRAILRRALKLYYIDLDRSVRNIENSAALSQMNLIDLANHKKIDE